jgi:hypothetical protein
MKRDTKGRPAKKAAKPKTKAKTKTAKPAPPVRPDESAIEAQIKALVEINPRVRRTSAFGDNHHNAIDAQIKVLIGRMSEDEALNHFDGDPDNIQDAIRDAVDWLEGKAPSLVESWRELVR